MNKKIIAVSVGIVLVVIMFPLSNIYFHSKAVKFTVAEQDWINRNKNEILFMGYYDSIGERYFARKLCGILSSETGLRIVPYNDSWENTMMLLKFGRLPMSSAMNMTEDRLKYLNFTQSFSGISAGIYSNMNRPIYNYKDISGKNIGVVKQVKLLDDFLKKYPGISFHTVFYDDVSTMTTALRNGEIDGFISTKNYHESMSQFYYFKIPAISAGNNHIGVHKDYPELYSIISKEVDHLIRTGWADTVQKAINFDLERQNLQFNEAETAYLKDKPTVTIGLVKGYSFYGYEKEYEEYGIIPNIFNKIYFLTDIKFVFVFDSYDNLVKNDRVDLIPVSEIIDNNSIYSNYMFSHSLSAVGKRGLAFIREIYDLEPYRVGILEQDPEIGRLIEQMPYINLYKSSSVMELLRLAETREMDYVLLPGIISDMYISQFDQLTNRGMLDKKFNYVMTKDESNRTLIDIINKCLAVIDINSILNEEAARYSESKTDKTLQVIVLGIIVFLLGIIYIIPLIIKKRKAQFKLMYTNPDTGIENRIWLERKISKGIEKYTFFTMKLKEFHTLKERYGQRIYKKALETTVRTVKEHISKEDLFVSIDKERFLIGKYMMLPDEAETFAHDLMDIFGEKILIHDMIYSLRAHVGFMGVQDDINNLDGVLECLDMAVCFSEMEQRAIPYSYEIYSRYHSKIEFDKQFISMVMNERLEVFYRNIYDNNGNVFALDAYSTFYMEEYGYLSSKNFNEAAKRLDFASQADRNAIKLIIRHMAVWEKQGKAVRVQVDICEETILNEGFLSWLAEITCRLQQSVLVLKIESRVLESNSELLSQVRSEKTEFLMKNFGADVLNIVESNELPVETVCIHSDFILNLSENELYEEMLDYIVLIGKKLDKKVMILDIDTGSQYEIIRNKSVDYIGGKYLNTYVKQEEVSFENFNSRGQ